MLKIWCVAAAIAVLSLVSIQQSLGQPTPLYGYTIKTAAGTYPFGNGGPATQALLAFPRKLAFDSHGALYVSDASNQMIRKIAGGTISLVTGTGIAAFSGDGQPAINAQISSPGGVAADASGNVFICDAGNSVIRKVNAAGIISTVAGMQGVFGATGDGGPATQAKLSLSGLCSIVIDAAGNVLFSEPAGHTIRKITVSSGLISTVAGVAGKPGKAGDGGPAKAANLNSPSGLALDGAGNLYIADVSNHAIRMVAAANGSISTVAGNFTAGNAGDGGPAKSAQLAGPNDVAVDAAGDLFIADTGNSRIRKVTAVTKIISTLAGTSFGFAGDGGPASAAQIGLPQGIAVDSSGTVYISDTTNNRIRTVSNGNINTFAGASHFQGDGGKATDALLYFPNRIAWDSHGNLFIADKQNNRIRKITSDGNITTVAGNGSYVASGDGGPALSAGINQPIAVAVDSSDNIYFTTGNQVRKVDSQGTISTIVNTKGNAGFIGDGGPATTAALNVPNGLAIDSSDNLYIADTYSHRIRKVSVGIISTVVGSGPTCGFTCNFGSFAGDGGPATSANLAFPYDLIFDSAGNMIIADTVNYVIRKVDVSSGNISTIAGTPTKAGYGGDVGPATAALLSSPLALALDSSGNLFISEAGSAVVRMVDALGIISTIAGTAKLGFSGDGGPATAAPFDFPNGIVADSNSRVWVADTNNHRVRLLTPSGPQVGNGPLGVVNAASFVSGGLVPGGMATLFGSHLSSATGINLASGLPLATELMHSSVKFNNTLNAPIFAVDNVNGQEQINFQVPWELDGQSSVVLQVNNNGTLGTPVRVPVLAAQPGVFAYNVGADLFGVILHANFTLADKAHPLKPDEVVLIFCTDLGKVTPAIQDGVAGSGTELTVAPTTVTIGGLDAHVSFSGLASGFVGLYQVNAQVPKGLAAKNQEVVVKVSGASSKTVLVPVGK